MKMRNLWITALVLAFVLAVFGCASTGGGGADRAAGGDSAAADVFRNGSFANGAKLGQNVNPVSVVNQRISVTAIPAESNEERVSEGFDFTVVIDFDQVIDCSAYNALVVDWEGIYSGSFGGVAMSAILTTADGKKTGSVGEWTQQQALGKVVFNFIGQQGIGTVNDGVLKEDEVPWRESGKTCKSIEINCDFAMRAGGEDEGWDWFVLNFPEVEPWLLTEIKFF